MLTPGWSPRRVYDNTCIIHMPIYSIQSLIHRYQSDSKGRSPKADQPTPSKAPTLKTNIPSVEYTSRPTPDMPVHVSRFLFEHRFLIILFRVKTLQCSPLSEPSRSNRPIVHNQAQPSPPTSSKLKPPPLSSPSASPPTPDLAPDSSQQPRPSQPWQPPPLPSSPSQPHL